LVKTSTVREAHQIHVGLDDALQSTTAEIRQALANG